MLEKIYKVKKSANNLIHSNKHKTSNIYIPNNEIVDSKLLQYRYIRGDSKWDMRMCISRNVYWWSRNR